MAVVEGWVDVIEVVPYYQYVSLSPIGIMRAHLLWPTIIPASSSFGTLPCTINENINSTHGKYGALNTTNPKKLSIVSGFFLLQM